VDTWLSGMPSRTKIAWGRIRLWFVFKSGFRCPIAETGRYRNDPDLYRFQKFSGEFRKPAGSIPTAATKPRDSGGNGRADRDESHRLVIETKPIGEIVYLPVKRGSVTIHDERIVHGSGGNTSSIWRKTYVMAFRDRETVDQERAIGFTHSHNDQVNWDEIIH